MHLDHCFIRAFVVSPSQFRPCPWACSSHVTVMSELSQNVLCQMLVDMLRQMKAPGAIPTMPQGRGLSSSFTYQGRSQSASLAPKIAWAIGALVSCRTNADAVLTEGEFPLSGLCIQMSFSSSHAVVSAGACCQLVCWDMAADTLLLKELPPHFPELAVSCIICRLDADRAFCLPNWCGQK